MSKPTYQSPFLALLMANARLCEELAKLAMSQIPYGGIVAAPADRPITLVSPLAAAAEEQLAALTRLRAELDHTPAAR